MKKSREQVFNPIYAVFSALLFLLTLGYSSYIILKLGFYEDILTVTCLFTVVVFITGVIFILTIKHKVAKLIRNISNIFDEALSGEKRVINYTETTLSAMENKIFRYLDISRTKEKNMEDEKEKIKSLISDISHQTKTPLSNIVLYSQLLLEKPILDEDSRQIVESIKGQSDKLDWLIQSLIKMSRLETGIISIEQSMNPIIQTITKAIFQIYGKAEEKSIEISVDCNEKIMAFHDIKWTCEAVSNILENAVKYTDTGGKISISVVPYELFIRMDIADTGMGIEDEEFTNIFKRFYRCKSAAMYEGVGIGLFLTREIINLQGGYIKVSSRVGKGTVFSVFLPKTEK